MLVRVSSVDYQRIIMKISLRCWCLSENRSKRRAYNNNYYLMMFDLINKQVSYCSINYVKIKIKNICRLYKKKKTRGHEHLSFSFLFIYDDVIVAPRWIPSFPTICGIANGRPFHDDADPWIWPTLLSRKDNSIVRRSLLHGIDQILPFACTWLASIVDSHSSVRFYSKKFNLSPHSPYPRRYPW